MDQGIFVLQCGDPTGTGAGGPSYTVKDENLAAAKYTAGAVAMANGGPNTNGSQFFFVTKDSSKGLAEELHRYRACDQGHGHPAEGRRRRQRRLQPGRRWQTQVAVELRHRQDRFGGRRRPDAGHRPIAHRRDAESDRDAGTADTDRLLTRSAVSMIFDLLSPGSSKSKITMRPGRPIAAVAGDAGDAR